MLRWRFSSLFAFLGAAVAIQPDARPAVAAPLRDLPWAQLNVLHTTDVHGWFGGHLQEYELYISVLHTHSHSVVLIAFVGRRSLQIGATTYPLPTTFEGEPTTKA